jgi:hypothetical protein
MSEITLQEDGRRVYVLGNTFPIKEQIKTAGGHWDGERKAWWIGAGKKADIQRAIAGASAQPGKEEAYGGEVRGKAEYKGRQYYVRWQGVTSRGTEAFHLVGLDGKLSFFADASLCRWTKRYEARSHFRGYGARQRAEYPTLAGIRNFIAGVKDGSVRVCAMCGKSSCDSLTGRGLCEND